MTEDEFEKMVKELKMVTTPDLVYIVEEKENQSLLLHAYQILMRLQLR